MSCMSWAHVMRHPDVDMKEGPDGLCYPVLGFATFGKVVCNKVSLEKLKVEAQVEQKMPEPIGSFGWGCDSVPISELQKIGILPEF